MLPSASCRLRCLPILPTPRLVHRPQALFRILSPRNGEKRKLQLSFVVVAVSAAHMARLALLASFRDSDDVVIVAPRKQPQTKTKAGWSNEGAPSFPLCLFRCVHTRATLRCRVIHFRAELAKAFMQCLQKKITEEDLPDFAVVVDSF